MTSSRIELKPRETLRPRKRSRKDTGASPREQGRGLLTDLQRRGSPLRLARVIKQGDHQAPRPAGFELPTRLSTTLNSSGPLGNPTRLVRQQPPPLDALQPIRHQADPTSDVVGRIFDKLGEIFFPESGFGGSELALAAGPAIDLSLRPDQQETRAGLLLRKGSDTTAGGTDEPKDPGEGSERGLTQDRPPKKPHWFARGLDALLNRVDVNAFSDPHPDGPKLSMNTRPPVPRLRSTRDGALRAMAMGLDRRGVAFLRMGTSRLREESPTDHTRHGATDLETAFLEHSRRALSLQAKRREALDPVLRGIGEVDNTDRNATAGAYAMALRGINPRLGRYCAEAILFFDFARREFIDANSYTRRDQETWNDLLLDMGVSPDTSEVQARQPHAFSEREIDLILAHPLLAGLEESAALRQAFEAFQQERERIQGTIQAAKEKRKTEKAVAGRNVNAQRYLERTTSEANKAFNDEYKKAVEALQGAMHSFLSDTLRRRVFLIQALGLKHMRRGLSDLDRNEIRGIVDRHLPSATGDLKQIMDAYSKASLALDILEEHGDLESLGYGLAGFFRLTDRTPARIHGDYERALADLIGATSPEFWNWDVLQGMANLDAARQAQKTYHRSEYKAERLEKAQHQKVAAAKESFYQDNEPTIVALNIQELELQRTQALYHLERIRQHVGNKVYGEKYQRLFETLDDVAKTAVANYTTPDTRGKNSRDVNRSLEEALTAIYLLRHTVKLHLKSAGLPHANFWTVAVNTRVFTDKLDATWHQGLWQSVGVAGPLAWHLALGTYRLLTVDRNKQSVSLVDDACMRFGAYMTSGSDMRHPLNPIKWLSVATHGILYLLGRSQAPHHTFVVDPNVDQLAALYPSIVSGTHTSWGDFALGPTILALAAQQKKSPEAIRGRLARLLENSLKTPQRRYSRLFAPKIAAKGDLSGTTGPLLGTPVDMITELIGSSRAEYDTALAKLARRMAYGDADKVSSVALYPELTMAVANDPGLFYLDPYPGTSETLALPQGGRDLIIGERHMALTGETPRLLLTTSRNMWLKWFKPDKKPLPMRRGPVTTVTEFHGMGKLWDVSHTSFEERQAQGNWVRLYWELMANTPEYHQDVPAIARMFEPYETPTDVSIERKLQAMFGGAMGVYPTAERAAEIRDWVEDLRGDLEDAREAKAPNAAQVADLELQVGTAERAQTLYELQVVQNEIFLAKAELEKWEKESVSGQKVAKLYPGVRQYRKALNGRARDLAAIDSRVLAGDPLSPRQSDRWTRLRNSYLGEEDNKYRSKVGQHLDLLEMIANRQRTIPGVAYPAITGTAGRTGSRQNFDQDPDPLLTEMLSRQDDYVACMGRLAAAEKADGSDSTLDRLEDERMRLDRRYREAVEAYYFLKGYLPTSWMGSFGQNLQNNQQGFSWNPKTWPALIVPHLISGIALAAGAEPITFDGALFPPVHRYWDGDTLVIEPVYPATNTGLSRRALVAAFSDTLRIQIALANSTHIDPSRRNFDGFVPGWLYGVLVRSAGSVRIEGLDNLFGLRGENVVPLFSHRGFGEFAAILGVAHEWGNAPTRIVSRSEFRDNPFFFTMLGGSIVGYGHPILDRDAKDAHQQMRQIGGLAYAGIPRRDTEEKLPVRLVVFGGGSRTETVEFDGQVIQGPLYATRTGVGSLAEGHGHNPRLVAIDIAGPEQLTPKSVGAQFRRGVPVGGDAWPGFTIRIGKPFRADDVREADMDPRAFATALASRVDQEFEGLSGVPIGPLRSGKGPKTLFQAGSIEGLQAAMAKRLEHPEHYRDSVAVLHPSLHPDDTTTYAAVTRLFTEGNLQLPEGKSVRLFFSEVRPDGSYHFRPLMIRHAGNQQLDIHWETPVEPANREPIEVGGH